MYFPNVKSGWSIVRAAFFLSLLHSNIFAAGDPAAEVFSFSTILLIALLIAAGGGAFYYIRYIRPSNSITQEKPANLAANEKREQTRERRAETPSRRKNSETLAVSTANTSKVYDEDAEISDLPISRFTGLEPPTPFEELEESTDPDLLDAIEQLADEVETDPEVRLLALKILARFRTRISVETLAEIARFDLSSTLRSKAVGILADFDHPSVFAPIVMACADPTKEVRSAAARALVRLSFDRGEAWARVALSEDAYLTRQVARAAVEAGLAEKSFDRLTMRDPRAVYEAFALTYLLIKAGETQPIFDAIRNHRDMKIRLALIHTIKVANVAEVIPQLCEFIAAEPMASRLADRARDALLNINNVPVNRI